MERRARHKPRTVRSGESLQQLIIPEPDDVSRMQPFITGPDPPFLLLHRYRKRQIKTTRGFRMGCKVPFNVGKVRNDNIKAIDQGIIVNKMDKLDGFIEKHSMKVYCENL